MKRKVPALVILAAVLIAALGVVSVARMLRHPGALEQTRAALRDLRQEVDSCQASLEAGQAGLLQYNDRLDSMRGRVRDMEALHPRGVPADSYSIYIDRFREYNDSAAAWSGQVDRLEAVRDECVVVINEHNALLDSLRRLLADQRR